ncbi:MAG: ATP-binding protein [Planctomycetaceae bacterium]
MAIHNPLGQFYFGKEYNLEEGKVLDNRIDYDAKDLCTHAVCVGMTGSGKTGLCLSLLEEAALDGIPAICIDPKGDLGNLLLSFPGLSAAEFQPWIDKGEATRKGMDVEEFAQKTADNWRKGLKQWDYGPDYVQAFKDSVDIAIYTPASSAGLPLTVLKSFDAPNDAVLNDSEALRDKINSTVSGLLALMQIDADPISSREHILLSNILSNAWSEGRNLDMGSLIREIQAPPFDKVGFMDLEAFFPAKDRFKLSMQLNNLLASPGFAAWMEGEPLDIQRLYYTPEGKPRISIISIAHLSDSERMFFVTILLNELLAWMRAQEGTSTLRSLFYMDEVFGYFPPTANPPSKQPMLTLLKQARAFGLGCVLATQNPVDIDYKGLSNAGTWFLGRLQTERDKMRVIEGLEGASAQAGSNFDKAKMEQTLAGLGSRVFLMNNVHEDQPVVFHTRWVLSYLRGPLSRAQIKILMDERRARVGTNAAAAPKDVQAKADPTKARPVMPPGIEERFLQARRSGDVVYRPALFGSARAHYIQSRSADGIDEWREISLLQPMGDDVPADVWEGADELDQDDLPSFETDPVEDATYADVASELTQPKKYSMFQSQLKDHIYRNHTMKIWKCKRLKEQSEAGESEADFRIRLKHAAREMRDIQVEKLRRKYATKIASAEERVRKAEQRVERESEQAKSHKLNSMISIGSSVLGALFGRKLASSTNVRRAGTAARSLTRGSKEAADVAHAEETLAEYMHRLEDLNVELEDDIREIEDELDIDNLELDEDELRPRKSDLSISEIMLVWAPWTVDKNGIAEPIF